MTNYLNILRFLTFVRNDIYPYYDTTSRSGMTNLVFQSLRISFKGRFRGILQRAFKIPPTPSKKVYLPSPSGIDER
jgi:hypothetical protein